MNDDVKWAIASFAASAVSSFVVCFPAAQILTRVGLFDVPNRRSSHQQPTIRGGGLGIILILVVGGVILLVRDRGGPLLVILPAVLLVSGVSFFDDLKSLSATLRLGNHMLAALMGLAALGWPNLPHLASGSQHWLGLAILLFWIVGYTNAFNFMDGINGIAAGQAMIAGLGTAILVGIGHGKLGAAPVVLSLLIGGAAAGFLPHNFPRARMFMGDVGSAPIGYLQAIVVCWLGLENGARLLLPLLLLHANFILDTGFTLLRRLLKGQAIQEAHREHFYQRLVRAGWTHTQATLSEFGLQVVAITVLCIAINRGAAVSAFGAVIVVSLWLGFFTFCEIVFRNESDRRGKAAHI